MGVIPAHLRISISGISGFRNSTKDPGNEAIHRRLQDENFGLSGGPKLDLTIHTPSM